jgi:SAM-dependent methyltransferase
MAAYRPLLLMTLSARLLERTFVYRLWQAPFADQKFAPILANNDLRRVRRVLDVGCGPGTSTPYFSGSEYLGVDINERYIRAARQRHKRDFLVADVRNYIAGPEDHFDFVLANSFLHHLNNEDVLGILTHMRSLLTEDGAFHTLELVMPKDKSVARLLAQWDRGKFARSEDEWQSIFGEIFEPLVVEFYPVNGLGTTLWNMVYFKGRPKI